MPILSSSVLYCWTLIPIIDITVKSAAHLRFQWTINLRLTENCDFIKILFFILFKFVCLSRHSVLDESSVAFPETGGTRCRTDLCIFYSRGATERFFHKNSGENYVLFLNISIPIGQQFVGGDKQSMPRNLNLLGLT